MSVTVDSDFDDLSKGPWCDAEGNPIDDIESVKEGNNEGPDTIYFSSPSAWDDVGSIITTENYRQILRDRKRPPEIRANPYPVNESREELTPGTWRDDKGNLRGGGDKTIRMNFANGGSLISLHEMRTEIGIPDIIEMKKMGLHQYRDPDEITKVRQRLLAQVKKQSEERTRSRERQKQKDTEKRKAREKMAKESRKRNRRK